MQEQWHSLPIEKVFIKLKSRLEGLSPGEVKERLSKSGLNKLPEEIPPSKLILFIRQLASPLIYILLIAGIVTFALGDYTDTIVIFAVVFINTIIGYFQESKASESLRELKKILQFKAVVLRNNTEKEINQKDIAVGDIIFLREGNKVPADARIFESHNMHVNEAALTGEWIAASKHTKLLDEKTSMADRDNMVYMGTIIESGWGKAIVIATGLKTEIGKVAKMVKSVKEKKTPYQKKLLHFSKIIGLIIIVISFIIFAEGMITGGKFIEMFTISIAVAVAAIPEGLPIAMIIILAIGMQQILKRKGLVRRIASAETLGSTSVILTDKTGTLTEAKMQVAGVYTGTRELLSNGRGFNGEINKNSNESHILALKIAMLGTEAFIENLGEPMEKWVVRGNPTEKALLLAGIQAGLLKKELEKQYPQIDKVIFSPILKYSAGLYRLNNDKNVFYVVGSPDKLLDISSNLYTDGKIEKLLLSDFKKLKDKYESLTRKGLRVLAVAYREVSINEDYKEVKDLCDKLTFVGFFALHDPIRKGTKQVIDTCRRAGMRPIIVTGDHRLTAKTVAENLGFKVRAENILEGKELSEMSDEKFKKIFKNIQIYARVEPAQKLRIVQAWQNKGEIVAMTGDGINDAPALRQADIGVAIGSGTDVAKEVSDLILLTNNFSIIVAAVEEGRAIVDNIRKVIVYLLSDSFTEVILIGGSLLMGFPLPIYAAQILWVNLIEDGPMGISLAFEEKEDDIMKQKPRAYSLQLLNKEMKALIFIIGFITDFFLFILFFILLKYSGYDINHIRSIIFAGLTIDSLFYIFSCKSLRHNIWHINPFSNKFLFYSWASGIIMLVGAIYFTPLQILLKTVPLNFLDWVFILILGLLNLLLIETVKWFFISKHQV
ncbi:cation-translocating P-type ATPase [Patescibacteria group bacterium]